MEKRCFGLGGVAVPAVGLGTWMMEEDRKSSITALRAGIEAGALHVDTAEMYGSGRVEQIVGEAIRNCRDRLFLVSKVLPSNATYPGTLKACERSLKNLGTDYLDCYLLHWPGAHPLYETIRAFEDLAQSGKIRSYGVSNFDVAELKEAIKIAGKGKLACNQVLYHIQERAIERAVLPWCRENGLAVVAYSPLGQGDFPEENSELQAIAAAHQATPRQIALRFLLREREVLVIPKSSRIDHTLENIAADSLVLTESEIERLEKAFPRGKKRSLPTL